MFKKSISGNFLRCFGIAKKVKINDNLVFVYLSKLYLN